MRAIRTNGSPYELPPLPFIPRSRCGFEVVLYHHSDWLGCIYQALIAESETRAIRATMEVPVVVTVQNTRWHQQGLSQGRRRRHE
jgi:hypothetical protein